LWLHLQSSTEASSPETEEKLLFVLSAIDLVEPDVMAMLFVPFP